MASAPVIAIGISWRDRDANRAKATCYCPISTPEDTAWSLAIAIANCMVAISDAVLTKIELVWRWRVDDLGTPPEESTVERKILMLVINEDAEINGMSIPSPRAALWETTGAYAGIRLDLLSAGAVGFADMLAVIDLQTEDGRIFGTELAAGGLAL